MPKKDFQFNTGTDENNFLAVKVRPIAGKESFMVFIEHKSFEQPPGDIDPRTLTTSDLKAAIPIQFVLPEKFFLEFGNAIEGAIVHFGLSPDSVDRKRFR